MCVGKQLAMMEMRTMLARVALEFDMELAQDAATYEKGLLDVFTLHCPDLMVKLTPRQK